MKDILKIDGTEYSTGLTGKYLKQKEYSPLKTDDVRAFIPGLIHDIYVKPGQIVKANTPLISLEAMKMFNEITVNFDIVVQDVTVKKTDTVEKNQILLTYKKIVTQDNEKPE